MIYLEQVTPLAQTLIDSAQLDETGNYKLELCDVDRTPALYNLVCNGDKIPLFLQGGDRLTVSSVGRVVHNYTVEGSEESELLRRFYQPCGRDAAARCVEFFAGNLQDDRRGDSTDRV